MPLLDAALVQTVHYVLVHYSGSQEVQTTAQTCASNDAGPWQLHGIHELCSSGSKASDNSLPFLFLCHLVAPETLEVMLVTALLVAGLAFCL